MKLYSFNYIANKYLHFIYLWLLDWFWLVLGVLLKKQIFEGVWVGAWGVVVFVFLGFYFLFFYFFLGGMVVEAYIVVLLFVV